MTRVAVIGHVEWVDFLRVDHLPVRGEVQAAAREFTHAGGGAVVAAAVLAEAGAEVDFYCAVGNDANGAAAVSELQDRGISVHAAVRPQPTRQVLTLLDHGGERTIITLGERLQPAGSDDLQWNRLRSADGVYLTAGDGAAAAAAREARVLVATPRIRERLDRQDVSLDAVVFSSTDDDEVAWANILSDRTRLMVATEGDRGGRWWGESEGRWAAVDPPSTIRDSYGCGDSFAAAFMLGLASEMPVADAAHLGATWGARMLARVGAP
jgi:ribokinase